MAFLSDRSGATSQIYLIPADGGEAYPLTKFETEGSISSINWSPDGKHIAFLYRKKPEVWTKKSVEERKERELPTPPQIGRAHV